LIDRERLLANFLELIQIDSPSDEEGKIAQHVLARLRDLGLEASIDATGNVIARLAGEGESLRTLSPYERTELGRRVGREFATILLNAHLDNVMPCVGVVSIVADGVVRSDGRTVLGADDKAGVAVILEVLQAIRELPHPPLEVALTVQEETGLRGAKGLDFAQLQAKMGISLDTEGSIGSIVVSAPSHNSISAVVHGKAAHAGTHPEEGINAILVAAEAIAQMPLGRIDFETTANIGVIKGGRATNIVPDRVEVRGEARSRDEGKLRSQTDKMVKALQDAAGRRGATVDVEVEREYSTFNLGEGDEIVQRVIVAARFIGLEPELVASGGGSDANIFNAHGIRMVNVSTGMEKVHTTEEHIAVADMVKCAELVAAILTT